MGIIRILWMYLHSMDIILISWILWIYLQIVDIVFIGYIIIYLALNVHLMFHIYSSRVSDWCIPRVKISSSRRCNVIVSKVLENDTQVIIDDSKDDITNIVK